MQDELKNGQKVVGAKQVRRAVLSCCAQTVFLAENADPMLTSPLADLCAENQVPVQWVPDAGSLGTACGVRVAAAAAALLK